MQQHRNGIEVQRGLSLDLSKDQKFKKQTLDLVGLELFTFQKYVILFSKTTKTPIKKINLESAYHTAISNPHSEFGVDELTLLIGDFKGDHKKLQKISKIPLQPVRKLLETGSLL